MLKGWNSVQIAVQLLVQLVQLSLDDSQLAENGSEITRRSKRSLQLLFNHLFFDFHHLGQLNAHRMLFAGLIQFYLNALKQVLKLFLLWVHLVYELQYLIGGAGVSMAQLLKGVGDSYVLLKLNHEPFWLFGQIVEIVENFLENVVALDDKGINC